MNDFLLCWSTEGSTASVCHYSVFSISNMIKTRLCSQLLCLLSRKEMWTKFPEGHDYTDRRQKTTHHHSVFEEYNPNHTGLILTGGVLWFLVIAEVICFFNPMWMARRNCTTNDPPNINGFHLQLIAMVMSSDQSVGRSTTLVQTENNCWMGCRIFFNRHSWFLQDESDWLRWSPDFPLERHHEVDIYVIQTEISIG